MLLVYRIHALNFPLFWFLSFFIEINAHEIKPFLGHFKSKRIKLVNWDKYFTADEITCLRSEAVKTWERILPKFPSKPWRINYDGLVIDFTKKAKQEIGSCFEYLYLFREIQNKAQPKSKIYIVNSREFAYISRIAGSEIFPYTGESVLSGLNITSDAMLRFTSIFPSFAAAVYRTLRALIKREQPKIKLQFPVKCVWDAVNPGEMNLTPEKLWFPWIIDEKLIEKKDVVFLAPPVNDKVMNTIKSSNYQVFTIGSIYKAVPQQDLLRHLLKLFLIFPGLILLSIFSFENLIKADYMSQALLYEPLVKYLKPRCYVVSISSIGGENPAIEYFNSCGIKTVLYCYSANSYLFTAGSCDTDFRIITFANIISSSMVVWHDNYRNFIEAHPQDKLEIKVIGPLMAGNEKVFDNVSSLRAKYSSISNNNNYVKYISVFDVASWSKERRLLAGHYPYIYTEEYCNLFIEHMFRLAGDLDNIIIIFKPKRNIEKTLFAYSDNFKKVLAKLIQDNKGVTLDENINPWIPIALADLCIAIPFTSPVIAAWQYGKPGLFHDPTGSAKNHRYQAVSEYITHNYEQLRSKVVELLSSDANNAKTRDPWLPAKAGFAGIYPGLNSSDEFRRYLNSLTSK